MKITADTNVLVRALTEDDARQGLIAQQELGRADLVALTLSALCELVWVLSKGYKIRSDEISEGIRRLINGDNVVVNRPAVNAGLVLLAAGGDFADGVIAYDGGRLGGEVFVSFDRKAVKLIQAQGGSAQSL